MRQGLLIGLAAGLVIVGAAFFGVMRYNLASHIRLEGAIQKVRTIDLDGGSALIVDFRVTNPAGYPFVVSNVAVSVDADGSFVDGFVISDVDAKRLFQYYPAVGQKYNDSLKMRDKIAAGQTVDRMIAARFELAGPKLEKWRALRLRIEDVDGAAVTFDRARE